MQVQTGCGPGLSQEVSWLRRCTDVVRACLQVVHGVTHELETVTDMSGPLVSGIPCHRQRHLRVACHDGGLPTCLALGHFHVWLVVPHCKRPDPVGTAWGCDGASC